MDIYIAVCKDRHIDVVVKVFSDMGKAVDYAKKFMKTSARFPEDIKESYIKGWLYHATFSCEGDSVHVEKGILDPEE